MTFGSGVVAILAGIVSGALASSFGPVAPFDGSLVLLVIGGAIIAAPWSENYGDNRADSTCGCFLNACS